MIFHEHHEEQPGARGGVWHLHHVASGKQPAAVSAPAPVAVPIEYGKAEPAGSYRPEAVKSKTLAECLALNHSPARHSDDGMSTILECVDCVRAWKVTPTGDEIRLHGAIVDRLAAQNWERQQAAREPMKPATQGSLF